MATFWREIPGTGGELVACPAQIVGESAPICEICHEPEQGHSRRTRRHAFTPIKGTTLDVEITDQVKVNGQWEDYTYTHRYYNVPTGTEANQYSE